LEKNLKLMKAIPRKTYNKEQFVETIKTMLPDAPFLQKLVRQFQARQMILKEYSENDSLYVILDGKVSQVKEGDQVNTKIDKQGPGDFIGLLSFQTGEPVFTSARAETDVTVLVIDHENFDELINKYPDVSNTLQGLIFTNLSDRYRRVVTLHVEVDVLSQELKREKDQLKRTIQELEHTRNMLISQEKMAVLGELTAGLAHEMNNPASALLRSVEFLITNLPGMLEKASRLPETRMVRYFFEMGQQRVFSSSAQQRERMRELSAGLPHMKRSEIRVLSELNQEAYEKLLPFAHDEKQQELLNLYLEAFQAGVFMTGIRLSTARIEYLVKSLKSFSRHTHSEREVMDIRTGIMETLQMLGSHLKNVKVEPNLPDVPPISAFAGEINQVWTNIIINACDAMEHKGSLFISCREEEGFVEVRIGDTGPGVADKNKKKIFDSSFTTKTAGGEFGLGIGLAITKSIIEKHEGTVDVTDREGGGAEFVVRLPVYKRDTSA
jgi:signal transduction histidine kinase